MKWIVGNQWHIVSDPPGFAICKAKMGNAHRTYYRYTLAEGDKLLGTYDTAEEAKAAAEARA